METTRDRSVKLGDAASGTTYVSMLRLNYIRGLDAHGMAELLNDCTEYCEKYKYGVAQCTKLSCVGCIEEWLNEQISVPVALGRGKLYIREIKEETCEK